jgi:hypothetical protein
MAGGRAEGGRRMECGEGTRGVTGRKTHPKGLDGFREQKTFTEEWIVDHGGREARPGEGRRGGWGREGGQRGGREERSQRAHTFSTGLDGSREQQAVSKDRTVELRDIEGEDVAQGKREFGEEGENPPSFQNSQVTVEEFRSFFK